MVVVQESVSLVFIEKLKYKMKQFSCSGEIPSKFKDRALFDKVNKFVNDAKDFGAVVISGSLSDEFWSPTAVIDYQVPDLEEGVPVLTVLTCRNVKEAATLVNTSRYSLATSIWCEISSQAMEVAFMLASNTVWINCHGISSAGVTVQPTHASGDGSFGGKDGKLL